MPDYRFQSFGCDSPCIAQINFMMQALICNIEDIPLALHILVHECDSSRFIIIRADVHTLNALSLVIGQELDLGKIRLLFLGCFLNCPFKIFE